MSEISRLQRQKQILKNLLDEMTKDLPPMIQTIVAVNRSTVCQLLDNLSEEQMDEIVSKARAIVNLVDCKEGDYEQSESESD